MKTLFTLAAVVAVALLSGCSMFRQNSPGVAHPATTAKPSMGATNTAVALAADHAKNQALAKPAIVTPDLSLMAKVVAANDAGRFVVVSFPANQMPRTDQALFIYRSGLKVAEVKVNENRRENLVSADIVSGEAKVGDTVRGE
jgi:hypothetical protein